MAVKVLWKQWRALLADPRTLLIVFAVPFAFLYALPGFGSRTFPALMIAYVLFGLQSTSSDSLNIRAGLTQFPVSVRDHVLGLFLYQVSAVLAAGGIAAAYVAIAGPAVSLPEVMPKSIGLGLLLAGLIPLLGLWLRPEIARVVNMVLVILGLNLAIFQGVDQEAFMPFISAPAALLAGAAFWGLSLGAGLMFPPRM